MVGGLITGLAALASPTSWAVDAPDPIVRIETGTLRGTVTATHKAFLGIPYALPPLAQWRWKAPQPPTSWTGERDATRMKLACPQPLTVLAVAIRDHSEDCLHLNVYTPAAAQSGDALPVIVWIHGGASITGSALEYPAARLAESGKVIVVTLNYRLGVLGFLPLTELQREDRRMNFGIQDQQAALRWVQRNIGQFGGDKGRVTLAGESAGGQSVLIHLVSPLSRGLMHRAIIQSAAPTGLFFTPLTAEQAVLSGEPYVAGAGCAQASDRMACMRGKPVEALLNAVPYSMDFRKPSGAIGPVVDGELFPAPVFERFKAGDFAHVPLLLGMNRDELQVLVALSYQVPTGRPPTEEEYQTSLAAFGTPPAAASLLTGFYPSSRYGSPQNALSALMTDFLFICPNHRATKVLARQVPTYAYRFDDRDAPNILDVPGVKMLAYHGAEVPYLFEMWTDRPRTPEQEELAMRMKTYWANFATTGDPNLSQSGADKTLPHWPRFTALNTSYKVLKPGHGKETLSLGALSSQHKCLFWDLIESLIPPPVVNAGSPTGR